MNINTTMNEEEWLEAWRWELFRSLADFLHAPDAQRRLRLSTLVEEYARCHAHQQSARYPTTTFVDYHVGA